MTKEETEREEKERMIYPDELLTRHGYLLDRKDEGAITKREIRELENIEEQMDELEEKAIQELISKYGDPNDKLEKIILKFHKKRMKAIRGLNRLLDEAVQNPSEDKIKKIIDYAEQYLKTPQKNKPY